MKWLNPLVWWQLLRENAFVAWLSSVQTWVTGAFPLSLAYPDWARELVNVWFPVIQEMATTFWEWAWHGLGP